MPYALSRRRDPKTGEAQYCVILEDTGKIAPGGCHGDDRAAALRHLSALASATEDHKLIEPLSKAELVVARYMFAGLCNKEIARALVLQESTVRTHLQNIRRKLNVSNRSGMIIKMMMLEMVRLHELPELVVLAQRIRRYDA